MCCGKIEWKSRRKFTGHQKSFCTTQHTPTDLALFTYVIVNYFSLMRASTVLRFRTDNVCFLRSYRELCIRPRLTWFSLNLVASWTDVFEINIWTICAEGGGVIWLVMWQRITSKSGKGSYSAQRQWLVNKYLHCAKHTFNYCVLAVYGGVLRLPAWWQYSANDNRSHSLLKYIATSANRIPWLRLVNGGEAKSCIY